jgi:hypothetical protein
VDGWTSPAPPGSGYAPAERRDDMYIGIGTLLLIIILLVIFL